MTGKEDLMASRDHALTAGDGDGSLPVPPANRCRACFKTSETVPVMIRWGPRGEPWVESTIRRCARDECWNTTGGTLAERIQHIGNVYDYKYFGDYELSPEQLDAVHDAFSIARELAGGAASRPPQTVDAGMNPNLRSQMPEGR